MDSSFKTHEHLADILIISISKLSTHVSSRYNELDGAESMTSLKKVKRAVFRVLSSEITEMEMFAHFFFSDLQSTFVQGPI